MQQVVRIEDIRNGRIRDAVEVFKELEAKYGF